MKIVIGILLSIFSGSLLSAMAAAKSIVPSNPESSERINSYSLSFGSASDYGIITMSFKWKDRTTVDLIPAA